MQTVLDPVRGTHQYRWQFFKEQMRIKSDCEATTELIARRVRAARLHRSSTGSAGRLGRAAGAIRRALGEDSIDGTALREYCRGHRIPFNSVMSFTSLPGRCLVS